MEIIFNQQKQVQIVFQSVKTQVSFRPKLQQDGEEQENCEQSILRDTLGWLKILCYVVAISWLQGQKLWCRILPVLLMLCHIPTAASWTVLKRRGKQNLPNLCVELPIWVCSGCWEHPRTKLRWHFAEKRLLKDNDTHPQKTRVASNRVFVGRTGCCLARRRQQRVAEHSSRADRGCWWELVIPPSSLGGFVRLNGYLTFISSLEASSSIMGNKIYSMLPCCYCYCLTADSSAVLFCLVFHVLFGFYCTFSY